MYQQHMLLKLKKLILKYTYIIKNHVHLLCLNLLINIKIPVTILQIVYILQDSYITKFGFMNYDFAKLVLAWLYRK